MQTRDFIQNNIPRLGWRNSDGKARRCSSVIYDDGVIYSYGSHYPMLFKIDPVDSQSRYPIPGDPGVLFINTSGWSVSTARQIRWCWQAVTCAGQRAFSVKIPRRYSYPLETRHVITYLTDELEAIALRFYGLHKNAHALESALISRSQQIVEALEALGANRTGIAVGADERDIRVGLTLLAVQQKEKLSTSSLSPVA